jgi:hypothetical protein
MALDGADSKTAVGRTNRTAFRKEKIEDEDDYDWGTKAMIERSEEDPQR